MPDQIVEITQPGHGLSKSRGFLAVHCKGEEIGKVPLDDLLCVLISVPGCSVSTVLIDHLCQINVPLVICGANYLPTSFTLPVQGYSHQFQVMQAQTKLSEPRRKRAWQQTVRVKILNQAKVLEYTNQNPLQLKRLAARVQSGDPDNCEAQAARLYWQLLFGKDFRRDRTASGLNSMLNYAYTVIRACVARGISSAGLHPSFGIHHKNPRNAMNLVDDLMEPFRPIADYLIWQQRHDELEELTTEIKSKLASIVTLPVPLDVEISPLSLAAVKSCRSFANYCLGNEKSYLLPELPIPLDMVLSNG